MSLSPNRTTKLPPPITTRLAEQRLSNAHPVWGFKTQDKFFRVMKGTAIPNSSIRSKILNSEKLARENASKTRSQASSSTSEDEIAAVQKREKSLEELKVLNNLLKKTHKVEKRPPVVKKTRFEIIIESIRDSKKKALEVLSEKEEDLLEEPELDKVSNTSSTTTIEMSKMAIKKARRRLRKRNLEKIREKAKKAKMLPPKKQENTSEADKEKDKGQQNEIISDVQQEKTEEVKKSQSENKSKIHKRKSEDKSSDEQKLKPSKEQKQLTGEAEKLRAYRKQKSADDVEEENVEEFAEDEEEALKEIEKTYEKLLEQQKTEKVPEIAPKPGILVNKKPSFKRKPAPTKNPKPIITVQKPAVKEKAAAVGKSRLSVDQKTTKKRVSIITSASKTQRIQISPRKSMEIEPLLKPARGILPLRSRQDFTTDEVVSFLKNRTLFEENKMPDREFT